MTGKCKNCNEIVNTEEIAGESHKCKAKSNSDLKSTASMNLNIRPPEFLSSKEEFPSYKRRLQRWSRSCGLEKALQGDVVLMYTGKSEIAEMLDREIGEKLIENVEGVDLIIKTLENWYGKESSVDLYQSFIQWKEMKRSSGQDVLDFITKYEDAYNRLVSLLFQHKQKYSNNCTSFISFLLNLNFY